MNENKKNDPWNIKTRIEENSYFWNEDPVFFESKESPKKVEFNHIDLFSGCGGFSTGFTQANFQTTIAVDIHPQSLETLLSNHRSTVGLLGDIKKIDSNSIKQHINLDKVNILTAGVPCQGFSLSNRKRFSDDKRNYLFRETIRIAKDIKPTVIVIENVSGLVSTSKGQFKRMIADAIRELGYDVYFSMLNASDYGVPQQRRRVFFVGVPKGLKWVFPNKNMVSDKKFNVGDAIIGDLPDLKNNEEKNNYIGPPKNDLQKYFRSKSNKLLNHKSPNHPDMTIEKIKNTIPGDPIYPKFRQRIRLSTNKLSPTQICGGIRPQFQFGHPIQPRGLTIRERARIQSFPDNYFFSGGIVQGRIQTGNAVPPLMAKALAEQIKLMLNEKKLEGKDPEYEQASFFS